MSQLRPFAVHFFGGFASSVVGFFGSAKQTQAVSFSAVFNRGQEFLRSRCEAYAFIPRFVILLRTPISVILRRSSVAQIFPDVVRLIFVDVVDFVFRPFAFHVKPRKAMGHIFFVVDPNFYSVFSVHASSSFSRHPSPRKPNFPRKKPGYGVVMQDRAEILCRQISERVLVAAFHHTGRIVPGAVIVKDLI